jgi:hypothetical protein
MHTSPQSGQGALASKPPEHHLAIIAPAPQVGDIVREINRLYVVKGLETARVIGEYVLRVCFHGDVTAIHNRSRHPASYRELARRPDLKVSATFIYSAVAVVEQLRMLPDDLAGELPLAHHRALLAIKDESDKVATARQAVQGDWSVKKLRDHVRSITHKRDTESTKRHAGRPSQPPFARAIRHIEHAVKELNDYSLSDADVRAYGYMKSSEDSERALECLQQLASLLEQVRDVSRESGDRLFPRVNTSD